MRLLLVQPTCRIGDGETDLAAVLPLVEASGVAPRCHDLLVLPELIDGDVADGRSSGAAGFARPNPAHVRDLFAGLGRRTLAAFEIHAAQIASLREDRQRRGFLAPAD